MFTDTSKTTALKFSLENGKTVVTVTCKKDTSKGSVTGNTTTEDELTLTGCKNNLFATNCYNVKSTKTGKQGGTIEIGGDRRDPLERGTSSPTNPHP